MSPLSEPNHETNASPSKDLSPVELIVLQGTSLCNLNCKYCDLSEESRRTKSVMEPKLIERLFTELFRSDRLAREVTVIWHSGEPLTLPPSYYEDAIGLIHGLREKLGSMTVVKFAIQTNGVLLNEDWCRFFQRHEKYFQVGVSCDGPSELHDMFRLNWNGQSTHSQAVRGMDLLHEHGIKFKVIAVVTRETLRNPDAFYKFFFERRDQLSGFHFNILADGRSSDPNLAYSAKNQGEYYSFFRRLLELNRQSRDAGHEFEILNLSQGIGRILAPKATGTRRYFEETSAPLKALNMDARGNVTTFYAGLAIDVLRDLYGDGKGFSLGNILETPFEDIVRSDKLRWMMEDFAVSRQTCEASCQYFSVCTGGFDILKRQAFGTFEASETAECLIHIKTLTDALLDDIDDHLELQATSLISPSSSHDRS